MWQQIVQVGERLWWRKCHQVRKDLRRGCIVRSLISFNFRGSALGHAHLKQPEPKTRTTGIHRNFQLRFKNQIQVIKESKSLKSVTLCRTGLSLSRFRLLRPRLLVGGPWWTSPIGRVLWHRPHNPSPLQLHQPFPWQPRSISSKQPTSHLLPKHLPLRAGTIHPTNYKKEYMFQP